MSTCMMLATIRSFLFVCCFCTKLGFSESQNSETPDLVEDLGCWTDTNNRVMSSLEDQHAALTDYYKTRTEPYEKCLRAALDFGLSIFGVQDGGECWATSSDTSYKKYGTSTNCLADGEGGPWALQVYKVNLTDIARLEVLDLGCWRDTNNRALTSLESTHPALMDSYWLRVDPYDKCLRATIVFGFSVFSLQHSGECFASSSSDSYFKHVPSSNCHADGEGGAWANHVYRIKSLDAAKYKVENLGCWADKSSRAIATLEETHPALMDKYKNRIDPFDKCLKAALDFGYQVFALQHGGWCASSPTALETYKKYGASSNCAGDGEGGGWANQVYLIKFEGLKSPECLEDDDEKGLNYRGEVAVTISGWQCQRWNLQNPNIHKYTPKTYPSDGLEQNFCRNPDKSARPWCYNGGGTSPRWEFCDIPKCSDAGNAVILNATCDDRMAVYVDGVYQYAANLDTNDVLSTIVIPNSFEVIAIKCVDIEEGLLASAQDSLGELVLLSDTTWKCSEVFEQGWELQNFDASSENWKKAIDKGTQSWSGQGQISSFASWIWTGKSAENIYCRAKMPWKRVRCPPLKIDHGSIRPDGPIPERIAVTITCEVGYKLTTHYRAVCLNNSLYDVGQPFCVSITVEQKEMFSDFTVVGNNMYTNLSMDISSTFFLKTMFSGNYDDGCGMTFNILDTDVMYHLDFRLDMKGSYRELIQASKWNGQWGYKIPEIRSTLPDLALENDIIVLVTDEYFEVTVNNIVIKPKFGSDLERLYNYKGISLRIFGECVWVDLQQSFMTNGGGFVFSLVDENNDKISLGQSFGLLIAKRAGFSQAGTVCGKNFDDDSATTLCQELGFRRADSWSTGLLWEVQSSYDVALSEVICPFNAGSFNECVYNTETHNSSDSNSCGHHLDVFLSCVSNNDLCHIGEHNGFMKLVCNDYNGLQYFKCLNSDVYYEVEAELPGYSKFSALCENDPNFYQTCGAGHKEVFGGRGDVLCGYYICEDENGVYTSSYTAETTYSCDDEKQCSNTDMDESDCLYNFVKVIFDSVGGLTLPSSKVCDNYCDTTNCKDESICGSAIYGLFCNGLQYYPPHYIGYNNQNWPDCAFDGSHNAEITCLHYLRNHEVPLFDFNRCATFKFTKSVIDEAHWLSEEYQPYCKGFVDQTNCTDPERIAMTCNVDGYPATISKNILCHGLQDLTLCDDGIENVCLRLSATCNIHKHQMCDKVVDCKDKSDENDLICTQVTSSACVRRLGERTLPTPLAWLVDGVIDCLNGEDEKQTWPTCGNDDTFRYVTDNTSCTDDFLCLNGVADYIGMVQLCDGIETCGNENEICRLSRDIPKVFTQSYATKSGVKKLMHCQKGLLNLQYISSNCSSIKFRYPKGEVFGLSRVTSLDIPTSTMDCSSIFGELYVYYSCEGLCSDSEVTCPIENNVLRHDSCPGQYSKRTYTVMDNQELTFLFKFRDSYSNDLFVCGNNRCIPFHKVCDLVDDCGDRSDEEMCGNHFRCASNTSYISTSQKCDGTVDCLDLSDECNAQCSKRIIQSAVLQGMSWTIGILAVLFNCIILFQNILSLKKCSTSLLLLNKMLIMLISVGDLLVGGYLVIISFVDNRRGNDYCSTQQAWLTGANCSLLGIFSTIGTQFSLFSMTALSTVRLFGIKNSMSIGSRLTKFGGLRSVSVILMIMTLSAAVALIPLHPSFEDFFVNGLSYEISNPLFTGFPDKRKHLKVLEAYYGRMKKQPIKWKLIVDMVKGMFTNVYGGIKFENVDFYGNDAVCLFKYFVKADDPQKLYVWAILIINFACFSIISLSYIVISAISMKSSKSLCRQRRNSVVENRNRQMNRKISIIILTDFCCWVPFILTCALHTFAVLDATEWYALFSIVVLPINSVINPLLYDTTISKIWGKVATKTKAAVSHTDMARSFTQKSIFSRSDAKSFRPNEAVEASKIASTAASPKQKTISSFSKGVQINFSVGHDGTRHNYEYDYSLQEETLDMSHVRAIYANDSDEDFKNVQLQPENREFVFGPKQNPDNKQ